MSQLTTLITGAAVTTNVTGQAQLESTITIGTIATAMPLQGLVIEVDGVVFISIVNQPAIMAAYAKWTKQANASGSIVSIALQVATGKIYKTTNYRFTNNGATTPNVYAFSTNQQGVPFLVGSKGVNATSYEDFQNFSALFIGTPANISSCEITFNNGSRATLATQEIDTLFGIQFPSEAGELAAVSVIDNRDQSIFNVRLYIQTATTTIVVAKIPDIAFAALKAQAMAMNL